MQRRGFLRKMGMLGATVALGGRVELFSGRRIGIIGLDTSHSVEFTKVLNGAGGDGGYRGYRVTAAYPYGSRTIASSAKRIPDYIEKVKGFQVGICSSIEELLDQVDCVLLETNDGHLHPEQARKIFASRKPVFIDKPLGGNLHEVEQVYKAAAEYGVSFFSSSSLRYIAAIADVRASGVSVLGAETFSPCTTEPTHDDLYWYGIHGVEMLFAVMGPGCKTVQAIHAADADVAVGVWENGRIGTFRGTRTGVNAFGGMVFGERKNIVLGDYEGYEGLLKAIIEYFETGQVPVPVEETKEIYAFMSAFQKSKERHGKVVQLTAF